MLKIEKLRNREIRIRMGASHKTIADEANVEFLHKVLDFKLEVFRGSRLHLCSFHFSLPPARSSHPCASRTEIIAPRMEFHVCGCSITSLGNMQPSQQIC